MISKDTIDLIFDATRVEEVIGEFIQLKKSGSNFKGFSPFSDEKSPSFMVSPSKQIWKDFSSGKGGNALTFLMDHEHFTYPEALKYLAKKYNIEVIEDKDENPVNILSSQKKENLFVITDFAKKYFNNQLIETEEGKNIGLSYFKERGFTEASIAMFELGYSPKENNAFTSQALKKGYTKENLEEAGLSIFRENWSVDRFKERVIFPIHSFTGKVFGFGGRVLKTTDKTAKYINSPESLIYNKSEVLYGVYQAKQTIIKEDLCVLVEGYTDVISLHQNGIKNAVASSGTSLTNQQIRIIKRLTNNLVIIYDGDNAGIKASLRGIDLILQQELNIKIVLLPEGEDPDSFSKDRSTIEIQDFIKENAVDFISFKAKVLLSESKDDFVKKAEVVQQIIESIALIPNLIKQEFYVKQCAVLLQVREEILFKQLTQFTKQTSNAKNTSRNNKYSEENKPILSIAEKSILLDPILILEEKLVQLMLESGGTVIEVKDLENSENNYSATVIEEIINQLSSEELELTNPFYNRIYTLIKEGFNKEELRTGNFFLRLMDEEITNKTSSLLINKHELNNWIKKDVHVPLKDENLSKETMDILLRYKVKIIDKLIKTISLELKLIADEERNSILKKIIRLNTLMKGLEKQLNKEV
ncbi:MAG: DNA primase [Solirubrobacteraceae bacterium]